MLECNSKIECKRCRSLVQQRICKNACAQKYDDAEKCLKNAIKFKSDMKEAHNDLVMVLRKKDDNKTPLSKFATMH